MPADARRTGYEEFLVQDLIVQSRTVLYRRERWRLPDGSTVVAPLPAGIKGHFGPELERFVLAQYHQGQTTMPRLAALLADLGVSISKRQLVRLLIDGQDAFLGLMKTCSKQSIRFWDYLGARLGVPGAATVPRLAELVRSG